MASTNKQLRAVATSMLTHVGGDIRDIDLEIMAVSAELEMLTDKMSDVKWAGNLSKAHMVFYQIMLKRTMRAILQKRRKAVMKETMK